MSNPTSASRDTPTPPNRDVPPGVRDPARRKIYNPVAGETVTMASYSCETNGEYTLLEADCVEDGGPPLHYHRTYAEHFEAVSGDLIVQVGNEPKRHLKPGETADVPPGVLHRFSAGAGGAKFTVKLTPGHPGFERTIHVAFGLAEDGHISPKTLLPNNMVHTAVLGNLGEMYFPGAGGALINGLTSVLSAYAQWSGTEEELLKKYWDV